MADFRFTNKELYCEGLKVSTIASRVGTPFYLYSYHKLVTNFNEIKKAFSPINPLVCFAMKSNDNMAVIKALAKEGAGFDIVSGGELQKALLAQADPRKIVFASVGKTDEEIILAIKNGILFFNVESEPELVEINRLAKKLNKTVQAALRINPDVSAATHDKITTGTLQKKFGIDLKTALRMIKSSSKYSSVKIKGLHIHIGSQITTVEPYVKALSKVSSFIEEVRAAGGKLEYLNLGGGIGISYTGEKVPQPKDYAQRLLPILKKVGLKIIIEPGRYISATAGIFVTKVIFVKDNGVKKFVIVDAGMNDLVRPSLYDAYHEIIPLKSTRNKRIKVDVVGPICESGDFFAHGRMLPELKRGDLIAIMDAGAYGYVMSSNYNVRGKVAEIMVKGNQMSIVKERESFKQLIAGENIPNFLK